MFFCFTTEGENLCNYVQDSYSRYLVHGDGHTSLVGAEFVIRT